jgi:hypothetical protein
MEAESGQRLASTASTPEGCMAEKGLMSPSMLPGRGYVAYAL